MKLKRGAVIWQKMKSAAVRAKRHTPPAPLTTRAFKKNGARAYSPVSQRAPRCSGSSRFLIARGFISARQNPPPGWVPSEAREEALSFFKWRFVRRKSLEPRASSAVAATKKRDSSSLFSFPDLFFFLPSPFLLFSSPRALKKQNNKTNTRSLSLRDSSQSEVWPEAPIEELDDDDAERWMIDVFRPRFSS